MRGWLCVFAVGIAVGCGDSHEGEDDPPSDMSTVDGGTVDLGAPTDSGTSVDVGPSDCERCAPGPIRWHWEGGLVAYRDFYDWRPCDTVVKTREDFGTGDPPAEVCTVDLGALSCDAVDAIVDAQSAAGLAAARAEAPVLYGVDSRPVDGAVFRIVIGGDQIDVGGECGGGAGCTPVPEAVADLRDALMNAMVLVDDTDECGAP